MLSRSGVSDAEVAAALPGDDLVPDATDVIDRATTLAAAPEQVWPWLVQVGKGRAGWYFPRRVERFLPTKGLRHIDPRLQDVVVGDEIGDWGPGEPVFRATTVDAPHALVWHSLRDRANRHRWPSDPSSPAIGAGAELGVDPDSGRRWHAAAHPAAVTGQASVAGQDRRDLRLAHDRGAVRRTARASDPMTTWTAPVRYAEVDGQGVVFNSHYLLYCDEAMAAFCRERDLIAVADRVQLVTSTLTWTSGRALGRGRRGRRDLHAGRADQLRAGVRDPRGRPDLLPRRNDLRAHRRERTAHARPGRRAGQADQLTSGNSRIPAACWNSVRGRCSWPSETTSRRKSSAPVQSAMTRTLRFSVGIRDTW